MTIHSFSASPFDSSLTSELDPFPNVPNVVDVVPLVVDFVAVGTVNCLVPLSPAGWYSFAGSRSTNGP